VGLTERCRLFQYVNHHFKIYTRAQWARITRKLAKIITLLVLIEIHIFNKIKMKISKISIKLNETNVIEEELSYSLSVLLLLYSESLGFITLLEVTRTRR
jgi:hypothetical protein